MGEVRTIRQFWKRVSARFSVSTLTTLCWRPYLGSGQDTKNFGSKALRVILAAVNRRASPASTGPKNRFLC